MCDCVRSPCITLTKAITEAGIISGWISDHNGVEWLAVLSFALAVPSCAFLVIKDGLVFFIASLAMISEWSIVIAAFLVTDWDTLSDFCLSSAVSPLTAELASITRSTDGVGCESTVFTRHRN